MTDSLPLLVGFTGYAGAGKDFVADLIIDELQVINNIWVEKVGWANGVREEIQEVLAHGLFLEPLWSKPTDTEVIRPLLQWWGTELRRAQDPDYWVKWGLDKIRTEGLGEVVFMPDTRFKNEADAIRDAGGFIVRVEADEDVRYKRIGKTPSHESEAYAMTLVADFVVTNNGHDLMHDDTLEAIMERIKTDCEKV